MSEQLTEPAWYEMGGSTSLLRGSLYLFRLSVRRLLRLRPIIVCAVLLALLATLIFIIGQYREIGVVRFTRRPMLRLYLTFLTPIFCICFSTASIANDRDDQTLVYLLTSALPRWLIHLAKFAAAWVVSVAWVLGGFAVICLAGGEAGTKAFSMFWFSFVLAGSAYSAVFHFFGTLFRRATIFALVYSLFFEVFVGNVPGTAKRIAVSFYTKCQIFGTASEQSIFLPYGPGFQPVEAGTATLALIGITLLFLALGTYVFQKKEYVDG